MLEIYGEIISTGSELMVGRMVDTNSAWLSETLAGLGVPVARHTAVGDNFEMLVKSFARAWEEHGVTVVTGGLGPTQDDLTREAVAQAFNMPLEFKENLADELRDLFKRRGYQVTDNNLRQAWLPSGAVTIKNIYGTAPGFYLEKGDRLMVFLPGVPQEMKGMTRDWLTPYLSKKYHSDEIIKTLMIKTTGYGESMVDHLIKDLMLDEPGLHVGLLAAPDTVRVVITARGENENEIKKRIAPVLSELEKRLQGHVFGFDNDTLPEAVAELLKSKQLRLTILDAITQGRLSGLLGPSLAPENWNGAQEMPWQPVLSGAIEILRLYCPDTYCGLDSEQQNHDLRRPNEVRLIVTAKSDLKAENAQEGDLPLLAEIAVQGAVFNNGEIIKHTIRLGGSSGQVLSRIANTAVFHLWHVLSGFEH